MAKGLAARCRVPDGGLLHGLRRGQDGALRNGFYRLHLYDGPGCQQFQGTFGQGLVEPVRKDVAVNRDAQRKGRLRRRVKGKTTILGTLGDLSGFKHDDEGKAHGLPGSGIQQGTGERLGQEGGGKRQQDEEEGCESFHRSGPEGAA